MLKSKSYIAIPPGATIKEQLIDRSMSQKEFAIRMGMSQKHISKLINGEVQLTIDMARRLELVLGVPTQFWCNLESIYREKIAKVNEENNMDEDIDFVKLFPYDRMSKLGWVLETTSKIDKVNHLRKYFEVYQLSLLKDKLIPTYITEKMRYNDDELYSLVSWIQKAKLEGRNIETKSVNIKELENYIPTIRSFTIKQPKDFCKQMQSMLANCGIAVVYLPSIEDYLFDGFTFYDGNKIVLGIIMDCQEIDGFWLSLFREIGRIVYGYVPKDNEIIEEDYIKIEEYSENVLIPKEEFDLFVKSGEFDEDIIVEFAKNQNIDVSIVLNRLEKYNYIQENLYGRLKGKYVYNTLE